WQGFHSRWIHRLLGAAPGTILLIHLLFVGRLRGFHEADAIVYLFLAGCSVPYLLAGVVERYELIVIPLVLVLLAESVDLALELSGRGSTVGGNTGSDPGVDDENGVESAQGG
ncbi:MAG: hypothetical protein R3234_13580, partial [Thermoanaerobaculia bacterium]|nr:hypothetical protein [Thermoanaerobaculia bacterium]